MRLPRPLARKALQHRRGIDLDARHLELIDIGAEVVLGVGDRRLKDLQYQSGSLLWQELERRQRIAHALAAHRVGHQPALLRRDARVAQFCGYLHRITPRP
jgi:hypothetical protein